MEITQSKLAVGALILSVETESVLLGLRAPYKTHPMSWALFGGMIEEGETPKEGLYRELKEELGFIPDITKIYPFDVYVSKDKHFKYYSYLVIVEEEFTPNLNKENAGYSWTKLGNWPKPMHQGAKISFCNNKSIERIRLILDQHQPDIDVN